MRALLLPLMLALIGLGAGAGAGWFLRPAPEVAETIAEEAADDGPERAASRTLPAAPIDAIEASAPGPSEFVRLNNQFVVPVVSKGTVTSLVVMSLSLEVDTGLRETVFQREPKLRDALLQVMFDHANIGGFDGAFTEAGNLDVLRAGLTDMARKIIPGRVFGVLIVDIARQDL